MQNHAWKEQTQMILSMLAFCVGSFWVWFALKKWKDIEEDDKVLNWEYRLSTGGYQDPDDCELSDFDDYGSVTGQAVKRNHSSSRKKTKKKTGHKAKRKPKSSKSNHIELSIMDTVDLLLMCPQCGGANLTPAAATENEQPGTLICAVLHINTVCTCLLLMCMVRSCLCGMFQNRHTDQNSNEGKI
jgi:hypothetical protein